MHYSEYGRTGKRVSAVGFGGMRFDLARTDEENAELLLYAQARGINYFDTAPSYCQDHSEDIYGHAFRQMSGEFWVSTKRMPTQAATAQEAYDSVRRSLERLHVPKIHFMHIWCLRKMEHYELAVRPGGMCDGYLRAQEEGLVDHIVCSSHQPGKEVRQILADGKVEGVLLGVNVLNFPYRWDGLEAAAEYGCGVVAMNPLAGGAIPQHEDRLGFLCRAGESPTDAALRFVIGCPLINVALVGFTTRAQIDQACNVAAGATAFTRAEMDALSTRLGNEMNAICTGCGYCANCPQDIPVPSYMQFYNDKQMWGKTDDEMRQAVAFQHDWGLLVGRRADAADCVQCGQCEGACTQHLPIVERLAEIARWEAGA